MEKLLECGDEVFFCLYSKIWNEDITIMIELQDEVSPINYKEWADHDTKPKHPLDNNNYTFFEKAPEKIGLSINGIGKSFKITFIYKKSIDLIPISYKIEGLDEKDELSRKISYINFIPIDNKIRMEVFTEDYLKDLQIEDYKAQIKGLKSLLNERDLQLETEKDKLDEVADLLKVRIEEVSEQRLFCIASDISSLSTVYDEVSSLYQKKTEEKQKLEENIESLKAMIKLKDSEIEEMKDISFKKNNDIDMKQQEKEELDLKLRRIMDDLDAADEDLVLKLNDVKDRFGIDENILKYYPLEDKDSIKDLVEKLHIDLSVIEDKLSLLVKIKQKKQDDIEIRVDRGE